MLGKISVGVGLMVLTTVVQGLFMMLGVRVVHAWLDHGGRARRDAAKALVVSLFTAWMFIGMVMEALIWSAFYLWHPSITTLPDLDTALYFSLVTFTTVGYGDVVMTGEWRILASIQAANGAIVFGWSAALIFYVIQLVYRRK